MEEVENNVVGSYRFKLTRYAKRYGWVISADTIEELETLDKKLREKFSTPKFK